MRIIDVFESRLRYQTAQPQLGRRGWSLGWRFFNGFFNRVNIAVLVDYQATSARRAGWKFRHFPMADLWSMAVWWRTWHLQEFLWKCSRVSQKCCFQQQNCKIYQDLLKILPDPVKILSICLWKPWPRMGAGEWGRYFNLSDVHAWDGI